MQRKSFDLLDYKIDKTDAGTYISGYANTKNKPDAFGDIPTNYKGEPVYDLSRFEKNPIALVDHENKVGNIFGTFIVGPGATSEDATGLKIKLLLMENPQTEISKHAVEAYKSGFCRAFSIGGKWLYEDKANKSHLTKGIIYEISGVAIPADPDALSSVNIPKSFQIAEDDNWTAINQLVGVYRKTLDENVLKTIQILKRSFI